MKNEGARTNAMIFAILTVIMAITLFTALIAVPGIASESPSTVVTAEEPEGMEMKELQQQIYDQGYHFTVSENRITRLSPEGRKALCGYKPLKAPTAPFPENVRFFSGVPKVATEKAESLPSSYDALALGYVTPVKDQAACGSCWIQATMADFESDVLINESQTFDFSEQELGDCNIWSSIGGGDFCDGGNSYMSINYLTKYGAADETCNPYAAASQTCQDCSLIKNVNNWRLITGDDGETQVATIKNAILTYGPVYSTIYASDPGFSAYYSGVYQYWGAGSPDHAIEIIGWDDSKTHSRGTGAWLIKNSWGTSWGAAGPYPGCAWVAYGAANLGDDTSAITGYKNADEKIFYHDECGWLLIAMGYSAPTAYGAVRFTPTQDSTLTAVDFWAVSSNMQYEIKIFDTLNTASGFYTLSGQLGTTQTGTTDESGYYSIPLNTPVQLTSGGDFIVQVKFTTTGYAHPLPVDYYFGMDWSSIAEYSGESYTSDDGLWFEKPTILGNNVDIGIRARATFQKPAVSIYTDKTSYTAGDTMRLGLDVANSGDALPVKCEIWLELPSGGEYSLVETSVSLSAGLDYNNPNFKVFTLPSAASNIYTWHVRLSDPVTGAVICGDSASWNFVSTGASTETAAITEMLDQATVVIDFGEPI